MDVQQLCGATCQYGNKYLMNVSSILLNLCCEELRQLSRQKGANMDEHDPKSLSPSMHLFGVQGVAPRPL